MPKYRTRDKTGPQTHSPASLSEHNTAPQPASVGESGPAPGPSLVQLQQQYGNRYVHRLIQRTGQANQGTERPTPITASTPRVQRTFKEGDRVLTQHEVEQKIKEARLTTQGARFVWDRFEHGRTYQIAHTLKRAQQQYGVRPALSEEQKDKRDDVFDERRGLSEPISTENTTGPSKPPEGLSDDIKTLLLAAVAEQQLTRREAKRIAHYIQHHVPTDQQAALLAGSESLEDRVEALWARYASAVDTVHPSTTTDLTGDAQDLARAITNTTAQQSLKTLIRQVWAKLPEIQQARNDEAKRLIIYQLYTQFDPTAPSSPVDAQTYLDHLFQLAQARIDPEKPGRTTWIQGIESFVQEFYDYLHTNVYATGAPLKQWQVAAIRDVPRIHALLAALPGQQQAGEPTTTYAHPPEAGQPLRAETLQEIRQFGTEASTIVQALPQDISTLFAPGRLLSAFGTLSKYMRGQLEQTFYHYLSGKENTQGTQERISISAHPQHAIDLMSFIVRHLVDNPHYPGIHSAKIAGPGWVGQRADNIILYVTDKATRKAATAALEQYQLQHRDHVTNAGPNVTKRKLRGVSLAAEPANPSMSYGQMISQAILDALKQAPPTVEQLEQLVQIALWLNGRQLQDPSKRL